MNARPPSSTSTSKRARRLVLAALLVLLTAIAPIGLDTVAGAEPSEGASAAVSGDQRRISAGGLHSCAVLDTGEVQCWGQNASGQLGNGTTAASTVPRTVVGITTALNVSAGNSHTCALTHSGTVKCWGHNGSGQLGNGTTSPPEDPVLEPVEVAGLDDAVAIAAGGFHTCAVRAGGTVVCWGHDGSGQLGRGGELGDPGVSLTPVTVVHDHDADDEADPVELTGASAVTAGEFHSCALLGTTGEVQCWGHNGFGQLGNGVTLPNGEDSTIAVAVTGLPVDDGHTIDDDGHGPHKALAISAGEGHTCAVVEGKPGDDDNNTGNTARCWGHNFYGQLGNNTTYSDTDSKQGGTDSSTPVEVTHDSNADPNATQIEGLGGVVAVTTGQFHSCAALGDGSARCWGNNGRGQLGNDKAAPSDQPPENEPIAVPVQALAGARAVTAGGFHNCALVAGNSLKCWGYNFYGQLGSYNPHSDVPVTVTAVSGAKRVTTGRGHVCALLEVGLVTAQPVCWGGNANGELGAGFDPVSTPNSTVAVPVDGIPEADDISAGNGHVCALAKDSGTPECWGRNGDGQLGDGTNVASNVPVTVSGITTATQVSAGGETFGGELGHSCAVLSDGGVRCWGDNSFGQLGDETTDDRNTSVTVRSDHDNDHLNTPEPDITPPVDLDGAVAVATGGRHSCALMSDTTVRCWGRNFDGQLGDGTTADRHYAVTVDLDPDEPEEDESDLHFEALTGIVAITAGARHTCAVKDDHTIWCWGRNADGQLGDGSFSGSDVPVEAQKNFAEEEPLTITAGDRHTCTRVFDNFPTTMNTYALCWGADDQGQLGNVASGNSANPVEPEGLGAPESSKVTNVELVTDISAGGVNTCASLIDETVSCWGPNPNGELGDGVGQQSRVPLDVLNLGSVGGNSIPVLQADAVTIAPLPVPNNIDVLANDTDPDGDPLTVTKVEIVEVDGAARGTASTNGTTVTYTPSNDFCDADPTSNVETLTYWVNDGKSAGHGPWTTITVTVNCPNTAPTVSDDDATTNEDTAVTIDVLDNDSDVNSDTFALSSVTQPANGTVAIDEPDKKTVTYTPNADFFGTDTFTYTATDGTDESASATVTVTVNPVNDAPVAVDDNATTNEDTPKDIDVVANDTDVDGPTLGVKSVADAPNGFTSVESQTEVTYTPDPDFCGVDTFTYQVTDGSLHDTATVTVDVACTNDGPNAVDDSATTHEDVAVVVDVLANDTDPEGDALTITSTTDPDHGTATINGGATITYTPDPDFCGADTFAYTVSDTDGETDSALVVPVVVICHNDPPVANDDNAVTDEDTAVLIDVRANDTDVDGDSLTVVAATDPANGTTEVTSSNLVKYTPDPDFCGNDSFDYTISDPDGVTDDATVTVTVNCVNDAPTVGAVADQTTPWGETINLPLTSTDPDAGDTATYSLVAGPAGASIVGNAVEWTPAKTQIGNAAFTVRATDSAGAFDDEDFTVVVTKRATALSYTGAAAAQYSDPAGVAAALVDFGGDPVPDAAVKFTIGSRTANATSDAGGQAAGSLVVGTPVGPTSVGVSFAGNSFYLPASTSAPFTVDKENVSTTFSGKHLLTGVTHASTVQLTAVVAEEADGHLGSGIATLQVSFRDVASSDLLCTGSVSTTVSGAGVAACTTPSLSVGSRAVIAEVSGAAYEGDVDVGAFAIAPDDRNSAAGAGRLDAGDDFAFQAQPVRKSGPAGDAVHVYRVGGTATVVSTDTLTSLARTCTGGKNKVCTATVEGTDAARWSVTLATGAVAALAGTSALTVDASDVAEPGAGSDTYAVELTGADVHAAGPSAITAGNIRLF